MTPFTRSDSLLGASDRLARLRSLAFAAVTVVASGCVPPEAPPPLDWESTDVLLLTACTLRADHLGAYGYERPTSPRLDQLAGEGIRVERVLTNAAWTRPAIAAAITGLHPRTLELQTFGERINDRALDASFVTLAERFRRAGYVTLGVTSNPNTNGYLGFDQGYERYRDTRSLIPDATAFEKLSADQVTARFLELLDERAEGRRFFAHLVFTDVHTPYLPADNDAEVSRAFGDRPIDQYDGRIRYLDAAIDRLRMEIRRRGRDNVLVVVHADHGEAFGRIRPEDVGHGGQLYDSTLWVPWLLHHPALEPRVVTSLAQTVDLPPTLLDLLGMEADPNDFAGRSLGPAIRLGVVLSPPQQLVSETDFGGSDQSALLADGWKLIENRAPGAAEPYQLYPIGGDETRNRSGDRPDVVRRLRSLLADWKQRHPGRVAASDAPPPDRLQRDQLRALGYAVEPEADERGRAPAP